jgi:hypothetical protein
MKRETQARSIARIIEALLGYTNGWAVGEDKYEDLCIEAATEILVYLRRAKRRSERRKP